MNVMQIVVTLYYLGNSKGIYITSVQVWFKKNCNLWLAGCNRYIVLTCGAHNKWLTVLKCYPDQLGMKK